ncbi:type II toxin-antitoxin system HicA family toxin [Desulfoscipio geothermicus]|uniref:type II toxin-antitoxin system HicA family toxin n=1 Tax=Desulfoscipio geothermicus TaxID=39060 RepID=UPI000AD3262C|nr:type II toxin-antitoxin system HicA family toxin [Desulfoscipio geothermicus]
MSKLEKLYIKIKNNPGSVKFQEIEKLLLRAGFSIRQPRGGSSHYTFTKGGKRITIPRKQPYVLETYIKKVIELLEVEEI